MLSQASKPVNRKSNPKFAPVQCVETNSDKTQLLCRDRVSRRPVRLPKDSAELKFRIQFPPAKSHANHPFLVINRQGTHEAMTYDLKRGVLLLPLMASALLSTPLPISDGG